MRNNKGNFLGCFAFSMAMHTALFITIPYHALKTLMPKKPIEISYQRLSIEQKISKQKTNKNPEIYTARTIKPTLENKKIAKDFIKTEIFRKKTTENNITIKKSVNLSITPQETVSKTHEYKDYYQSVRKNIEDLAYSNYKRLQEGKVYLTFTLKRSGELKKVEINELQSSKNEYLREIALESVQDASPYQEFPEKLKNNTELSFNVIISFELK